MKILKAYCLDENYIFPRCNQCNKELTPYSITSQELNNIELSFVNVLIHCELLRINAIEIDKHIIFICKKCCKIIKESK